MNINDVVIGKKYMVFIEHYFDKFDCDICEVVEKPYDSIDKMHKEYEVMPFIDKAKPNGFIMYVPATFYQFCERNTFMPNLVNIKREKDVKGGGQINSIHLNEILTEYKMLEIYWISYNDTYVKSRYIKPAKRKGYLLFDIESIQVPIPFDDVKILVKSQNI